MYDENAMIGEGYYSAAYFTKSQEILAERVTPVLMQVFQKTDAVLYGIEEAAHIIHEHSTYGDGTPTVVKALRDGDRAAPWETVMTIEGDLGNFVHLESVYLGILARGTRVATNMDAVVRAAAGKPVLFMGDRFDRFENQEQDGAAALVGGAAGICTPAMSFRNQDFSAQGTMPHALIAAFGGDIVKACLAYRETFPDQPVTALVDFNNDCVGDSLAALKALGTDLKAVRLDTSEKMVDKCFDPIIKAGLTGEDDTIAGETIRGVNSTLVRIVRQELNANDGEHVEIVVSGGFTPEKISRFEALNVPVDMYGVGSSIIKNGPDFTADVVLPIGKAGRPYRPNNRLKEI